MENINTKLAYQFWNDNFPELIDGVLTEDHAQKINFWDQLQTAYDAAESDTLWAILLSNLPMPLEFQGMFSRIKKVAKLAWHEKQHNA